MRTTTPDLFPTMASPAVASPLSPREVQSLHATMQTMQVSTVWQSRIFPYAIEPVMWAELANWMQRNLIEWRSPDPVVSASFEYRFTGFDK
jgi:hypothetical protein